MGIFVPVVDSETPRSERAAGNDAVEVRCVRCARHLVRAGRAHRAAAGTLLTPHAQAKHRGFHTPHSLHRGAAVAPEAERDAGAQGPVHKAPPRRFLPSPVWRGTKPGYFFSKGLQGCGYYADAAQGDRWQQGAAGAAGAAEAPPKGGSRRRSRSRSRERRRSRSSERDRHHGSRDRKHRSRERRSRSRERRRSRSREAPAAAAACGRGAAPLDLSKLEGSLSRKAAVGADSAPLTEEQRREAALARLAERRQAGGGARPGGHTW
jgi:hypothetical protein